MPTAPPIHRPRGYKPPAQRKKEADKRRPNAHRRGYNRRWRAYRLAFLQRHPLCTTCEGQGRVTAADCVDHIEPHKGDQEKFWDAKNHQALCTPCHNSKTAREDGRWG